MQVNPLDGHAIWSAVYDGAPNPLLDLERRTVTPWLPPLLDRTFIDVACGTGRWSQHASDRGAHVFGADFCAPMLDAAAQPTRNRFVLADAARLPFSDALADLTMCAFAAGYLECPARLIAELARITRRGGFIAVTDVHPAGLGIGWRRSFRRGGETYDIEHHVHPLAEYLTAARDCCLRIEHLAEACFGEPERQVFEGCGRAAIFEAMCRVPAVFAVMWRRA